MNLDINGDERITLFGATGNGKTEYAKWLLREINKVMRVVIIDVKNDWFKQIDRWGKGKEQGTMDRPRLVTKFNAHYLTQVYQADEYDSNLERFFLDILKTGYTFIYIDETEGLCTANSVPLGIRRIWKQGRSLNVPAMVSSQTYSGIPRIFKTQAQKFIAFKVGDEDASDIALKMHIEEVDMLDLKKWEYFFFDSGQDECQEWGGIWCPPLTLEKGHLYASKAG